MEFVDLDEARLLRESPQILSTLLIAPATVGNVPTGVLCRINEAFNCGIKDVFESVLVDQKEMIL